MNRPKIGKRCAAGTVKFVDRHGSEKGPRPFTDYVTELEEWADELEARNDRLRDMLQGFGWFTLGPTDDCDRRCRICGEDWEHHECEMAALLR